ncbi:MAG: CBS domain-containing protein [Phycisphaerales bacterium]
MSTVADILKAKGDKVHVIEPRASVLDAARTMNVHRIGALVVTDTATHYPQHEPAPIIGIITERDILTRVVATESDPAHTDVGSVMTTPVITCAPCTTLDELRQVMRQKRIRHMPVWSDMGLCGMISIGDLNLAHNHVMEETIRYLETYMYHG